MSNSNSPLEARVAVLVDCDNVPTDIVEHALLMTAHQVQALITPATVEALTWRSGGLPSLGCIPAHAPRRSANC